MHVLALDTSTDCCSVALLKDGQTECEMNLKVRTGHAGIILKLIDRLLEVGNCPRDAIDLIAVGRGPGSFTGIRIGIATAKGLAMALGCSLKGVCSLDAIVHGALPSDMPIMPLTDARKGELFCALYSPEGKPMTSYMNLPPENLKGYIDRDTLFLGNGLDLYGDLLSTLLGPHYRPGPQALWYPKASVIGTMARELPDDLSDVNPIYVRASDATLALKRA
jgi:tRNA threonylcarbamoyladenosine biosynthesis protein TsaB